MAKHAPTDIRAISENRKLVLDMAADLTDIIRERANRLSQNEFERRIAMCCVGATFALWRAVPLVHVGDQPRDAVEAAAKYLDTIIRTNAITYGDDDRERVWSFGFYMGNVRYRISEICDDEICRNWPGGKQALEDCGLREKATTPRKPGYNPADKIREYILAVRAIIDAYRAQFPAEPPSS